MDEEKVAASVAALNNFDADGFTTIVGLVYAFLAQQGSVGAPCFCLSVS